MSLVTGCTVVVAITQCHGLDLGLLVKVTNSAQIISMRQLNLVFVCLIDGLI